MISKKLSLNKVCIILATTILLLSVVMFSVLYILTKELSVVFCSMAFCLLFLLCVTVFVILIRRKLTLFSEILCCTLDEMMNGKIDISQVAEEENLFYKINHRLVRLYEVMQESKNSVASERADLQELISDISHQVKTPIANLKMVNATLLEQEVPSDKQREFLLASGTQLDPSAARCICLTECARSAVPTMAVRSSRSSPWPLANNDRVSLTGGKRGFPPAFLFAGKVCMSSAGYHGRCRSMGDAVPRQKIAAGWSEDTVAKSLPPCTERKARAS